MSLEENLECPLCMEPLELDDINFFPCTCGYQICRFCWHRIRTDENGLCPACRKAYPEDPAEFKPLTEDELSRIKKERRQKDLQRKQKAAENRKHLANVRVVQRNLVFVVGLSQRLADAEVLKKQDYFGKFGKTLKVVINQSTSYAGAQVGGPSASAYVTYYKSEDALRAIQAVNNIHVDGRTLKASLGTTKYCSHFLRGTQCPKPDCMYLHELGEELASFTKEEMQQGKHQEYEQKLYEQFMNSQNLAVSSGPPPAPVPLMSVSTVPPASLMSSQLLQSNGSSGNSSQSSHKSRKKNVSPTNNRRQPSPNTGSRNSPTPSHIPPPNTNKEAWPSLSQPSSSKMAEHLTNGNQTPSASSSQTDLRPQSASPPGSKPGSPHTPTTQQTLPNLQSQSATSSHSRAPGHNRQNSDQTQQTQPHSKPPGSHLQQNGPSLSAPSQQQQALLLGSSPSPSSEISAPASSSSNTQAPPPGLQHPALPGGTAPLPPGILPQSMLSEANRSNLQKQRSPFDNPGDSMSLFSMSGFSGAGRGKPIQQHTEAELIPAAAEIPDSLPSVSSTTDWQVAFGFNPSVSMPIPSQNVINSQIPPTNLGGNSLLHDPSIDSILDDDLGFDPWMESSKALADMVEKEGNLHQQQSTSQHPQQAQQQNISHVKNLPPGFTSNHIPSAFQQQNPLEGQGSDKTTSSFLNGVFSDMSLGPSNISRPPAQQQLSQQQQQNMPLNMMSSPHQQGHMQASMVPMHNNKNSNPGSIHRGSPHNRHSSLLNLPHGQNHTQNTTDAFSMKDWQDGLRALLPNINISFGGNNQSQSLLGGLTAQNNSLGQSSNLGNKSYNTVPQHSHTSQTPHIAQRQASWDHLDPAIVTSGTISERQNTNQDGGEPHWMASLHSLTEDNAASTTNNTNHRLPFVQQFTQQIGAPGSSPWPTSPSQPPPGFQTSLSGRPDHHHPHSTATNAQKAQLATEGL